MSPTLQTVISCPLCGTRAVETMPENTCRYLYRCTGCGQELRPRRGDCCVFCSYATVVCPPRQGQEGRDHGDAHRG